MSIDSLDAYLDFMLQNDVDDVKIYEHLARLDVNRVNTLIGRLHRIDNLPVPRGRAATSFRSRQSDVKGRIYEALVKTVVDGVKCFQSYRRVASSTNELDLLVMLGPSASIVPAMRSWSTHCVCECKYHATYVKSDWVTKLNTILQTHGTPVGLLFSKKGIAAAGNGAKIRTMLQFLANGPSPAFILCLDWNDLAECAGGKNFLQLISERFVEVRVGGRKLSLLAS